jgi:hypothetical protein
MSNYGDSNDILYAPENSLLQGIWRDIFQRI